MYFWCYHMDNFYISVSVSYRDFNVYHPGNLEHLGALKKNLSASLCTYCLSGKTE
jgi:hypothetical protein